MTRPSGIASMAARAEAPGHAKERGDYIFQQQAVLQQFANSCSDFPGRWQYMRRVPGDGKLPQQEQDRDEHDGAETDTQAFRPLSCLRSSPVVRSRILAP